MADVLEADVAAGVGRRRPSAGGRVDAEVLARALGHDDDGVRALGQPALEAAQEPALRRRACSGTSGISTKLASVDASAAWQAMKPECRPISLTRPMPLRAPVASTWAPRIASTAAANALSKPKLRSMKWMSLSIVLGMPMTAIEQAAPLDLGDDLGRAAQRAVAADHEQHADPQRLRGVSTISPGSWLPRDVPSTVPPFW